jgi:hypothetical protein
MQFLRAFLACVCVLSASAHAQVRTIPEQAKGGEVGRVQDMTVSIDGVEMRLAPGVRIRDQSNRMVFPTALPAGAQVKYLLDHQGMVRQVWILTPEEAKKN